MYYNSVIINFLASFIVKTGAAYHNSCTADILNKIALWVKTAASNSVVWNFIRKDSKVAVVWKESFLFNALERLANTPSKMLRNFYIRNEHLFSGTISLRAAEYFINRYYIFFGFSFFLLAVVPDIYWNNLYNTVIVLLLFFIFFIKTIIRKNEGFKLLRLDFALVLFIISVVLGEATSIAPASGIRFIIFYFTCFLLVFLMASSFKNSRNLGRVIEILLAGITLTALYGIYQSIIGVPVDPTLIDVEMNRNTTGRVYSTFSNPNNFAQLLILTIPFYAAIFFNSKTALKKTVYVLLALPPLYVLFLTGSRSGWIAFAVSICMYVFLKNRKLIPLLILSGILLFPLLPQTVYRRLLTLGNLANDSSAAYRMAIYVNVLKILKDFWFMGVGLGAGAFAKIYHRYFLNTSEIAHSHNLYLELCTELGIAGLLSFLWFMVRTIKSSIINIFSKTDEYIKNILSAGVVSITGMITIGLVEHIWFYPRVMLFFWLDVAIVVTCLGILRSRSKA